mgnify:CR=1 FL=1
MRGLGVSERRVRLERDSWILMQALEPRAVPQRVRDKNADFDDPDNFTHGLFDSHTGAFNAWFSTEETDAMLNEARNPAILATQPWLWLAPGLAISLAVLASFWLEKAGEATSSEQSQKQAELAEVQGEIQRVRTAIVGANVHSCPVTRSSVAVIAPILRRAQKAGAVRDDRQDHVLPHRQALPRRRVPRPSLRPR